MCVSFWKLIVSDSNTFLFSSCCLRHTEFCLHSLSNDVYAAYDLYTKVDFPGLKPEANRTIHRK